MISLTDVTVNREQRSEEAIMLKTGETYTSSHETDWWEDNADNQNKIFFPLINLFKQYCTSMKQGYIEYQHGCDSAVVFCRMAHLQEWYCFYVTI